VVIHACSVPGGTPSPADNDYTRINNAVQAATTGTTIELQGTFDWTEANAAASWALGSNGTPGNADDFSILAPAGVNNLSITAASLGAATIEGPGDLAAVDLEAFLVFDGGDNQNLQITNLRIRNFDLSIAMFGGSGGADAFNGALIHNNYILMPADLNAFAAPADAFQNIAIHLAFGQNQTISGNTIEIVGNGVSDPAHSTNSTSVALQSNTSGSNIYDGLLIDNNTIRVLNAQSANPSVILGIWENAHGHTSNITVSNNRFINADPGNNPSLNQHRGFRVTSHSSLTTTVTYANNSVDGASIGFQWISGSDFTGNQPVRILENAITNCATGVLVQSNGIAQMNFNRIAGGGGIGVNNTSGTVSAENNWWGCNGGPGAGGCTSVSGIVDFNPWLVLNISASPTSIATGQTSNITARLTVNSDGVDTSGSGQVPDGTPVGFGGGAPIGTVAPASATTTSGIAGSVFTAGGLPGVATVTATVDGQTVQTGITVTGGASVICLQDDSNSNFIVFNKATGDYSFTRCSTGLTLTGKGTVKVTGCTIRLDHVASDRRITATMDTCQKKGSASVQTLSPSAVFTITDRNTANNTCACAF
jgi:hypothetical protein